ncbi:UDP-N-acetylmuramoyl-L-alanine--D-glutamate ligase [Candidatus Palibaumannia cicadellinicola]|uniref:UDP-N-acetylmuramoylalanine--D-glutamate ligase n=1 Tax=Candidatus Palibaumannia cicadellinicola TaxID=186490 RepID=A0A088NBC9_9GAMM|nr:UDP-N-acetylmuramoyl-L-alanine--D-glutamate ligase [Candidatus Baumannia cicadellinicola]AIN47438.1 UDP-N-acetylmuramoylalanine--D-glutamate ligase [Candidatus Baumannia cicadellinicola]
MINYQEQNIVVIGLGITGISCVDFFCARGARPRVIDTNFCPPKLNELPTDVEYWLGDFKEEWLLEATLIVISPGVALSHPALEAAAKNGVEIIGDIELFLREVTSPVIAITGSNGKSTVTQLVSQMATCAGWQVGVGGNIGKPALLLLQQYYQLYILELSSFQLEITKNLKVAVATILNISEDHMNRYPLGLQQYRAAKLKIYQQATVYVVNAEDPLTLPINYTNIAKKFLISFGAMTGAYHLGYNNGKRWLMKQEELLLNCDDMRIVGHHNEINALAALALADTVAIPRKACLIALRNFSGLAHRFELVLESNGIRWINDSKATNVGSTKAAINALKLEGTLHLLLGGDGKLANFSPLRSLVQGSHIQLYCFGQDRKQLADLRPNIATITQTLAQAMYIIGNKVRAGDVVLLSPACSSLDQFDNFKARGKAFRKLVLKVSSCKYYLPV